MVELENKERDIEGERQAVMNDPLVKELIEENNKYQEIEEEFHREQFKLQQKYEAMQKPLLDKRREKLRATEGQGTAALPGFWLKCIQNHPQLGEEVHEWDIPAMECIKDIRAEYLPCEKGMNMAGFKVIFEFGENEFMTNTELVRIFKTEAISEHISGSVECVQVSMEEEIEWKAGKDPTIEFKKPKGKNNKKPKKEIRPSFFRMWFRNLDVEDQEGMKDLIEIMLAEMEYSPEDNDEEEMQEMWDDAVETINDRAYEYGQTIMEQIVPFAVRFYTGEVFPHIDDEDEEDSDEDEDDDDDESDEDEESDDDTDAQKKKKQAKAKAPARDIFSAEAKEGDEKKEECKQQ